MDAEPRTEITFTSERGHFQFPEVRGAAEFGFLAKLFHVPVVLIDVNLIEGSLQPRCSRVEDIHMTKQLRRVLRKLI